MVLNDVEIGTKGIVSLTNQAYDVAEDSGKTIKTLTIFPEGEDFEAIEKAEKMVREKGLHCGPMCRNEPIAICDSSIDYIAKWRNIERKDYSKMCGVMVSNDFRNGKVAVVLFN